MCRCVLILQVIYPAHYGRERYIRRWADMRVSEDEDKSRLMLSPEQVQVVPQEKVVQYNPDMERVTGLPCIGL